MTCTFFGHRNAPKEIEPNLRTALIDLIENQNVDLFYVGNKGNFDAMAYRVLKELSQKYSIKYYVVLAYMPNKRKEYAYFDYTDTILPDGIETVPKRYAIVYRNNWMIHKSDFVVAYVTDHINSSSSKFVSLAEKQDKVVIHLNSIP